MKSLLLRQGSCGLGWPQTPDPVASFPRAEVINIHVDELFFKLFIVVYICVCMYVCVYVCACVWSETTLWHWFFSTLHGFQGLSSGHQACAAISCTCCAILLAPRLIVLKYKSLYLIFLCGTVLV